MITLAIGVRGVCAEVYGFRHSLRPVSTTLPIAGEERSIACSTFMLCRDGGRSHPGAAALVDFLLRQLAEQFSVLLLFAAAGLHFLARERALHCWRRRLADNNEGRCEERDAYG